MATNSKFSADLGIQTDADLQVDGNVTVSGNLTVNGTQTTVNSTTTSVEDSMLELANANLSSDTLDIGIYGNYDDGLGDGVSEYTGFFRDASDSTWKLFDGLEAEPTTTVNTSGTGYTLADLQVGDLTATTLTATNALTGSSITYPTSDGTNGQVLKTNGSGVLSFGDIPAGYTDSDARSAISVSGDLSYNSSTGVISYSDSDTTYTDSDARSAISVSGNLAYDSSTGVISYTEPTMYADSDARSAISVSGNLAYNSSTGVISYSEPTMYADSDARSAISAGTGISYDSSTGVITNTVSNTDTTYSAGTGLTLTGTTFSNNITQYTDSDVGTYLSSNGYATQSTIVAAITDSAPATLDTLNELAAALGDDANFSTTVTNSIATKAPLASPSLTGTVTITGASSAYNTLQLTSNSTGHGTIINLGDTSDTDYGSITQFASSAGEGGRMRFIAGTTETMNLRDGKVGIGTSSPAQTLSVDASGGANLFVGRTGQTGGLYIESDGTNGVVRNPANSPLLFQTNGANTRMRILGDGRVGINRTPAIANSKLEVGGADNVPLINVEASGATGGMGIGSTGLQFFHGSTERMRISSDGATTFTPATTSDDYGFKIITGNSADTGIKIGRTGTNNAMFGLAVSSNGTNSIGRIQFDGDGDVSFGDAANIELRDGNLVRIQQAFSNPTYATNRAVYAEDQGELGYNASVRASKTNIADVSDVSWLYNLNAKTFNKRKKIQGEKQSDGTYSYSYSDTEHSGITEYGFIAEDLEALAPELCFYGYTRDVDADGNELDTFTKGELQGIHYESMVAPMLKLIQNQKDEIDALEARIATLESE